MTPDEGPASKIGKAVESAGKNSSTKGPGFWAEVLKAIPDMIRAVNTREQLIALVFIAITFAGVVLAIQLEGPIRLIVLSALFVLLIMLVIAVAYKAPKQPSVSDVSKKVDRICGDWWQFVLGGAENAVSHIRISVIDGRLTLNAQAFDGPGAEKPGPEGRESATWETVASVLDDKLNLFYMWSGSDINRKMAAVEGFGVFKFVGEPVGAPSQTGNGYFTAGDINNLKKESLKYVRLRRVEDSEKEAFAKGDKAKVALAALEKG